MGLISVTHTVLVLALNTNIKRELVPAFIMSYQQGLAISACRLLARVGYLMSYMIQPSHSRGLV